MKFVLYDWLGLNEYLFTLLNSSLNHGLLSYFFYLISILFKEFVFLIYYAAFVVYQVNNLSAQTYEKYNKVFNKAVEIGSIYSSVMVFYTLIKYTVNFPRPYCSMSNFISINNFAHERCLSSFPSAHTAMAIIVCWWVWPYVNRLGRILLIALVILVGLSRIALAMHYPADIIWSVVISLGICHIAPKISSLGIIQDKILQPIKKFIWQFVKK
ncbi:hypothetical protein phytr_3140 [Candidatus Phycorickettsia trachydisci]|uniref:Phosphatidic acid phosphatase type 2/haloperoxidase domain-containing protein n=1 Tax=Candidatus Phycorickettsia trachydisci TaxID=2115978 RepID=A0A2P1P7M5_9RICK|nr:phosphatase PAP2 family protein [Candidatus Phycorickettsia trachydisci]AVP87268.1 hypothetical protein phytr_3140 [Candidatus Phycorickettsia trachydisci]